MDIQSIDILSYRISILHCDIRSKRNEIHDLWILLDDIADDCDDVGEDIQDCEKYAELKQTIDSKESELSDLKQELSDAESELSRMKS